MSKIRIAAASVNQTPLDWTGNRVRIEGVIAKARDQGARLLCLPELCLSGYGCEDMFLSPHVRERSLEELGRLLDATQGIAVIVGLPLEIEEKIFNAMALVVDGRPVGAVCKQHLPGDGVHYEPRWFEPWPSGEAATIECLGQQLPVGDLVFDLGSTRMGVEVCRDAWVEDRPAHQFATRGVGLMLNPSASHFAFGKQEIRKGLVTEGSRIIGGPNVYANLLGNEAGRSIYDGGVIVADRGELIAEGPRFSYADHTLTLLDIDVPTKEKAPGPGVVSIDWDLDAPAGDHQFVAAPAASWETGEDLKHEEFSRAVPLGLFDYLRKCGARGFVLSLSGGADSGATGVLVRLMVELSLAELGPERLIDRLENALCGLSVTTASDIVSRLLTTVYQATKNSSPTTRDAANSIAAALGADHHQWEIDPIVEQYVGLAANSSGRPLDWESDDVALQNIQARVRSPGVWMLANLRGALLLATGNRSESSVGYATMDGDTSGGLAPLAGVDKAYLLEWLRWMETTGPEGGAPLAELSVINAQQPTAELRPPSANQTDEADLMPYAVLDVIERVLVAERRDRTAAILAVTRRFPKHPEAQAAAWVDRFMRLWRVSQWKRERLAPSFHLDTHNVDPKTWRRYPILSGGDELDALEG